MEKEPACGLGRWISIIHRKSQMHMNQAACELGLNMTECFYIIHLKRANPVSRRWLTDHLSMDDALSTRTLRGLEERGLLVQERSVEDQRALSVRLTEKGEQLIPKINEIHRRWIEELTRDFSEQEVRHLVNMLEKMAGRAINSTEKDRENRIC